jgi:REP-associated tyrosine transposase
MHQEDLPLPVWGGRREGAGRKPKGSKANPRHERRQGVSGNEPMHVTMRLKRGLPSLRKKRTYRVVKTAIELASKRGDFAVVQYSVQKDHLHLMIEADGNASLAKGIQSLTVRLARNLNGLLRRRGPVFSDRYHLRILKTPREAHLALSYILNNARRHAFKEGVSLERDFVDPISSSFIFKGWANFPANAKMYGFDPPELPKAKTWLLRVGWQKHGLLDVRRVPGS